MSPTKNENIERQILEQIVARSVKIEEVVEQIHIDLDDLSNQRVDCDVKIYRYLLSLMDV